MEQHPCPLSNIEWGPVLWLYRVSMSGRDMRSENRKMQLCPVVDETVQYNHAGKSQRRSGQCHLVDSSWNWLVSFLITFVCANSSNTRTNPTTNGSGLLHRIRAVKERSTLNFFFALSCIRILANMFPTSQVVGACSEFIRRCLLEGEMAFCAFLLVTEEYFLSLVVLNKTVWKNDR